jgi:HAD superfamily hydrolase (TIGR01549 family)
LREALALHGIPCPRRAIATYRRINEEIWARYRRCEIDAVALPAERFRLLLGALGGDRSLAGEVGASYLESFSRQGALLPGCRRVLQQLSSRCRLGIVTNGIDRVQRSRLQAARLEAFFSVVVTADGCGFAKPDPRILGVALEALRLAPAEVVYVGDDLVSDGSAARGAGVEFWWLDRQNGRGEAPLPLDCRRLRGLTEVLSFFSPHP